MTNRSEYSVFLQDVSRIQKELAKCNKEINFWQARLQRDTGNFVDMMELAAYHNRRFKLTGHVIDLKVADSLLQRSNIKLNHSEPDIFYALAQNAITQHRFRDAYSYNMEGAKAGGAQYVTNLLQFDAGMELGLYEEALQKLEQLKDKEAIDYLIRRSKWEDHKGNPGKAIILMEQVFEKVKLSGNRDLCCWVLSNLGDMYGHAGRVGESYTAYLDVLKKDDSYVYALKGLAWIAFSNDKNSAEAKHIIQYILSQTKIPGLYLILAEIEEWEGNSAGKEIYISKFLNEVEKPVYGNMYNKYLLDIYLGQKQLDKALELAEREVYYRPTPETYDWLAWVHFNRGDKLKAFELSTHFVNGRNFEPQAIMHIAYILAANGKKKEAKQMFKECLESSFELGPVTAKKIRDYLGSM